MTIVFIKMHGAGNDFVCLDGVTDPGPAETGDEENEASRAAA